MGMVIDGLLIGGIFALIAYGLALVWGVMNVKKPGARRFCNPRCLRNLVALWRWNKPDIWYSRSFWRALGAGLDHL